MSFELTIEDIPHYSYKDNEQWGGDWELIDGVPYSLLPSPNGKHQNVGGTFLHNLRNAIGEKDSYKHFKIIYSCDWMVNEHTLVRPDVMVVCDPIEGKYPVKPPFLILEILSPSSILKDRNTKFKLYQSYGVKYYLIANVDRKEIEYFVLKDNHYQQAYNLTEYALTPSCGIRVDFSGIFS